MGMCPMRRTKNHHKPINTYRNATQRNKKIRNRMSLLLIYVPQYRGPGNSHTKTCPNKPREINYETWNEIRGKNPQIQPGHNEIPRDDYLEKWKCAMGE